MSAVTATRAIYVSERDSGTVWSLGGRGPGGTSETKFHAHKIEFHERMEGLSTNLEIAIAPGDDVEIRRITLSNDSDRTREIDLTSYAEVVLAPAAAHERHPAFSKLFVHSERLDGQNALVFKRRPRRPADRPPVLIHSLLPGDAAVTPAGFETDRRRFLGRHGDPERPPGAIDPLDGAAGWTLDPVMALRARVVLAPGARAQVDFVTIAAGSRETALEIAERYASPPALDWAMEDALRSAALEARRLGLDSRSLAEAQALCHDLVFPRPPPLVSAAGSETALPAQPQLWSMGLSGDLPIVLVRVVDDAHAQLLPIVIRAHQWWLRHGLRADLVILRRRRFGLSGANPRSAVHRSSRSERLRGSGRTGRHSSPGGGPIRRGRAADARGYGPGVTRRSGRIADRGDDTAAIGTHRATPFPAGRPATA